MKEEIHEAKKEFNRTQTDQMERMKAMLSRVNTKVDKLDGNLEAQAKEVDSKVEIILRY